MDTLYQAKLGGDPHPPAPATHDSQPVPIHLPDIHLHPNVPARVRWSKPHPLLWLTLVFSVLALVLQVPKGSLPTLTGRHRALRAQERLVQERLELITGLSTFLPPPLSALVAPVDPTNPVPTSILALPGARQLELLRLAPQLRFWNSALGRPFGIGQDGERWWTVQDLAGGASVVKSKSEGQDREVWVIRVGGDSKDDTPQNVALTSALTHSLLLREQLETEIAHLRSSPCSVCPASPAHYISGQSLAGAHHDEHDEALDIARREEHERYQEKRKRDKERQKEVEEREMEVAKREEWVVEEMRKMSEKIHSQANELTLEDRITERLKQYQRQLRDHATDAHDEL